MNQRLELDRNHDLSMIDFESPVSYITTESRAEIQVETFGCGKVVVVEIPHQGMTQNDLKEAINFLKAVRRSLKAAK